MTVFNREWYLSISTINIPLLTIMFIFINMSTVCKAYIHSVIVLVPILVLKYISLYIVFRALLSYLYIHTCIHSITILLLNLINRALITIFPFEREILPLENDSSKSIK
jgi:hypothetical protein